MNRKIRSLGVTFAAALLVALAAAPAHAEEQGYLEASHYPSDLVGEELEEQAAAFTIGELSFECSDSTYTGELTAKATEATVTPSYSGCKSGESPATATVNGCEYRFQVGEGTEDQFDGALDVLCPEGKQIEVHRYSDAEHETQTCKLAIPAQSGLEGFEYTIDTETGVVLIEGQIEAVEGVLSGQCTLGFEVPFENGVIDVAAGLTTSPVLEQGDISASKYPAHIDGEQLEAEGNGFTIGELKVECTEAGLTGSLEAKASEVELTPSFAGCKAGERTATVTTNGCVYDVALGEGFTDAFPSTLDLSCPAEKLLEIHVYNDGEHTSSWCTAHFGSQDGREGLTSTLETAESSVVFEGSLEGMSGTVKGQCTSGVDINFETGVLDLDATATIVPTTPTDFTSPEGYPQTLIGENAGEGDTLTTFGADIVCSEDSYDGQLSEAGGSVTLTPTYSGCKTSGASFDNVTITHNGCEFVFTSEAHKKADEDLLGVAVECPEGKVIEVHDYNSVGHATSTCTTTVDSQNGNGQLTATSQTENGEILLEGSVGFKALTHGSCSFGLTLTVDAEHHFNTKLRTQSDAGGFTEAAAEYPQALVTEDSGAQDRIIVNGTEITCSEEVFDGTLVEATGVLPLTPTFNGCGLRTATHNGCTMDLLAGEHVKADEDALIVELACPEGKVFEEHRYTSEAHTTSNCTETMESQTAAGTLLATSQTESDDIAVEGTVTFTRTTHGACAFGLTLNINAEYVFSTILSTESGDPIHTGLLTEQVDIHLG